MITSDRITAAVLSVPRARIARGVVSAYPTASLEADMITSRRGSDPGWTSCVLLGVLCSLLADDSVASVLWPTSPAVNAPVCTAAGAQTLPAICSDGRGGAVVAWEDGRGPNADIYVQRVDRFGTARWETNGVALCTAANHQVAPSIAALDDGGAVVVWHGAQTGPDSDIHAQLVTVEGAPQWISDGAPVCTATGDQYYPEVIGDGVGGAIITWEDHRSGTATVYAQRMTPDGKPLWGLNGLRLCEATGHQSFPKLVSDAAEGAIIAWLDARTGSKDVYAQRVLWNGAIAWDPCGVPVCVTSNEQTEHVLVSDGAGGALIVWEDQLVPVPKDIYAQRVDASGTPLWTVNGVLLSTAPGDQAEPRIVTDGAGGGIVSWWTHTTESNWDVWAQRVRFDGMTLWSAAGVVVCNAPGNQYNPTIVADGQGGAVIAWHDTRQINQTDIYAQRVGASGNPLWTPNGVSVCIAAGDQYYPVPVSDLSGGVVVSWHDARNDVNDIYAQRIDASGSLGSCVKGHWRFEGTLADSSGLGNAGVFVNGGGYVQPGACFLGTSSLQISPCPACSPHQEVQVADSPSLRPASAFTLEAWVRPNSGSGLRLGKPYLDEERYSYALNLTAQPDNALEARVTSPSGLQTIVSNPQPLAHGEWHHVAATWDGSAIRLFLDGHQVAGSAYAEGLGYDARALTVGADSAAIASHACCPFAGAVDEVRICDVALTPEEFLITRRVCPLLDVQQSYDQRAFAVLPNPSRRRFTIRFDLEVRQWVDVSAFDAAGRVVATLFRGVREPGVGNLVWDVGTPDAKQAPGIYFIRLLRGDHAAVEKVVLLP